jgi:TetR/AcrR family transcriptional repressor of nem operon
VARPRSFDEDEAVERAMLLFWRRGYEGTSVRDLGEELGLRPGSLYAAFGNKESLFHRALDRYCEGQGAGLLAAVEGDGPLLPRLRALLLGVAEANRRALAPSGEGQSGAPPGCLMIGTVMELVPDDTEATRRVRGMFDVIEHALQVALARAVTTGELPAGTDAAAAAGFLTTFLQGLQVVSTADPAHDRIRASVDLALRALASGQ